MNLICIKVIIWGIQSFEKKILWSLERLSLDCQKWFAFTLVLHYNTQWLAKNSCHFLNQSEVKPKPIASKTKTNRDLLTQVFLRVV